MSTFLGLLAFSLLALSVWVFVMSLDKPTRNIFSFEGGFGRLVSLISFLLFLVVFFFLL